MNILLFGASGSLGTELKKINPDIICPTKVECNIINWDEVNNCIIKYSPDVIIHAGAVTDNRIVEKHPVDAIDTNIIGTANIAMECINRNIRLIYISTDYIYKGERGNYTEEDEILPFNFYSWTKLGGECSVRLVRNHLIIRTSFGASKFPYEVAFNNKYTSKDYVDIIAPMILKASKSDLKGTINIGTEKKTIFDYAKKRNKVTGKPVNGSSPKDSSLNLDKWEAFLKNS